MEALHLGIGVETYETRIKRTTLKSSKLARRFLQNTYMPLRHSSE